MNTEKNNAFIACVKFLPLLVFASLVILFGMDLLLAAPIAAFCAIFVYMIVKKEDFGKAFDCGLRSVKKIVLVFFILMFACAVAECFMATGVGASLILLALQAGVTGRSIAVVAIIITSVLSIATGTSWGTFAACAPIFLWLNHLVGGNVFLTLCSIAGGSCFGDNIGMISDVTVLSCGMQDVKIIDRVKHQSVWAVGCLLIACGIIFLAGNGLPDMQGNPVEAIESIPEEAYRALETERPSAIALLNQVKTGVPYYMMIPMLVVIVLSFLGSHTMVCLGAGMLSSLFLGSIAGTVNVSEWLELLLKGFSDAGSWTIVMMLWVAVFGGIMNAMDAFDPLARAIARISRNTQQLMGWCGVLCMLGNMALADETAQVATMSPIIRNIAEKNIDCSDEDMYRFRLRLATFTSTMGIYGSEIVPWHCFPVFFASIASSVYPVVEFTSKDIIRQNYMSFLVLISILLLTFTGWDRFIPFFALPGKDRAKLKKEH